MRAEFYNKGFTWLGVLRRGVCTVFTLVPQNFTSSTL